MRKFKVKASGKIIMADDKWAPVYASRRDLEEVKDEQPEASSQDASNAPVDTDDSQTPNDNETKDTDSVSTDGNADAKPRKTGKRAG